METFKNLPPAEVRQIINHKIDLQFTRIGSVNLTISVQILSLVLRELLFWPCWRVFFVN